MCPCGRFCHMRSSLSNNAVYYVRSPVRSSNRPRVSLSVRNKLIYTANRQYPYRTKASLKMITMGKLASFFILDYSLAVRTSFKEHHSQGNSGTPFASPLICAILLINFFLDILRICSRRRNEPPLPLRGAISHLNCNRNETHV